MADKIKLGAWLTTPSCEIAEIFSLFDYDWILFDLEHGSLYPENLSDVLRAAQKSRAKKIVRIPNADAPLICKVLDSGADGIMLPHADTPQIAADCVRAMRYPPHGIRGIARNTRSFNFGVNPKKNAGTKKPFLMAQIESPLAVENAQAIAEVEGVDTLFVGPNDLLATLGYDAAARDNAIITVAAAAKKAKKSAGILEGDTERIKKFLKMGITYIAPRSDIGLIRSACKDAVLKYRL